MGGREDGFLERAWRDFLSARAAAPRNEESGTRPAPPEREIDPTTMQQQPPPATGPRPGTYVVRRGRDLRIRHPPMSPMARPYPPRLPVETHHERETSRDNQNLNHSFGFGVFRETRPPTPNHETSAAAGPPTTTHWANYQGHTYFNPSRRAVELQAASLAAGFRQRQLESIRASRREYEGRISGLRSRAHAAATAIATAAAAQSQQSGRPPGDMLRTSFETLWRNSVAESVEEIRAQREFRERRREELGPRNVPPHPPPVQASLSQERGHGQGRGTVRRSESTTTAGAASTTSASGAARSRPIQTTVPTLGIELESQYLGEFTLGLVRKGFPSITLDQAIMEAGRAAGENIPPEGSQLPSGQNARVVITESRASGSGASSSSRAEVTANRLQEIIERFRAQTAAAAENSSIGNASGDIETNQNSTEAAATMENETDPNRENSNVDPEEDDDTEISPEEGRRALTELNSNLERLQNAIDQCESSCLDLQQMLTEIKDLSEAERAGRSHSVSVSTASAAATRVARDYCLSIWEGRNSESAGQGSTGAGSSLPTLDAYVTAIPAAGTPLTMSRPTTNSVQENETANESEREEVEPEILVVAPGEDSSESSSSPSSSPDTDEEEYNTWDAHSTMRNFTESTFNIDSDWEEGVRVGRRTATRDPGHPSRDISPATREFHRSIGILDSGDEDGSPRHVGDIIMMPNPRELELNDNLLGDATPLPLLVDNGGGGDWTNAVEVEEEAEGSNSEESEIECDEEDEAEEEEYTNSEENENIEENKNIEENDNDEQEQDEGEAEASNDWGDNDSFVDRSGVFAHFSQMAAAPFQGTPPPKVELDEDDKELEEMLEKIKNKDHKSQLASLLEIRQVSAENAAILETQRQKTAKIEEEAASMQRRLEQEVNEQRILQEAMKEAQELAYDIDLGEGDDDDDPQEEDDDEESIDSEDDENTMEFSEEEIEKCAEKLKERFEQAISPSTEEPLNYEELSDEGEEIVEGFALDLDEIPLPELVPMNTTNQWPDEPQSSQTIFQNENNLASDTKVKPDIDANSDPSGGGEPSIKKHSSGFKEFCSKVTTRISSIGKRGKSALHRVGQKKEEVQQGSDKGDAASASSSKPRQREQNASDDN